MIEILIVDNNNLVRDGIRLRLKDSEDIAIVGEAENGLEALKFCLKNSVDIILMDINMEEMDGLEATKKIKEIDKNIKVIILTSFATEENIAKAKQYHTNGFIYKETKLEDFIPVIKSVYNGYDVWTNGLLDTGELLKINESAFDTSELDVLEKKEIALIRCKVKCMQYNEIAKELSYSEAYVRQMAVKIKEKLGLRSVNELAIWGSKRGL